MELLQAIKTRRSTRRYDAKAVPAEMIAEILTLAAAAPSACNRRGWKPLLIQSRDQFEWLYLQGGSSVFQSSRQAILVSYERQTENSEWDDNIQSAAAYIAYFQLIAHERGIGSCWICHLPPKGEIGRYFSIPSTYTPVAVVTFGYYEEGYSLDSWRENPAPVTVSLDRWNFEDLREEHFNTNGYLRKLLRKIYYLLPFRSRLRRLAGRYEKKFDE